jgi:hypothetical protein
LETDREASYYDLLFSRQRYHSEGYDVVKEKRSWPGGTDKKGKYFPPGFEYEVEVRKPRNSSFVDFPRNETDWESIFGIDVIKKYLNREKINAEHGAIVEENFSIVARQNRLLLRIGTPTGAYWKTFDVAKTSGRRDFTEQLFFDFDFDAAEYISNLPSGAQAYFLTNAKGERLEVADNRFAKDSSDRRMDARVRNPGSCIICHREGINPPINHFKKLLDEGIDLKVFDPEKQLRIRAFLLNWDHLLKFDQTIYKEFVRRNSGSQATENAAAILDFRDWYDGPLGVEQISLESGLPVPVLKALAFKSPKGRLQSIVRGIKIPRRTFEEDVYPEIVLLHDAEKRTPINVP